ncbi:MAG: hypothetical protein IPN65_00035 [Elusimicrobia bacterium]|nr:hypothetical protein [Elusimicrobiota bacterium]
MKLFLLILCLALPLGIRAEKLSPVLQESPAEESHKDHEKDGEADRRAKNTTIKGKKVTKRGREPLPALAPATP